MEAPESTVEEVEEPPVIYPCLCGEWILNVDEVVADAATGAPHQCPPPPEDAADA